MSRIRSAVGNLPYSPEHAILNTTASIRASRSDDIVWSRDLAHCCWALVMYIGGREEDKKINNIFDTSEVRRRGVMNFNTHFELEFGLL